jgi:hypothetical protein
MGLATSTTDNAIVRFDSTTGATQNSAATIDDTSGALTIVGSAGAAPTATTLTYDTSQGAWKAGGFQSTAGSIPRVLHASASTSDTITASVVGTAETAFTTTHTLPANYLIANKAVRLTILTQVVGTAGPTFTLRLRAGGVGGTELYRTGSISTTSGTRGTGCTLWVLGTAAAGASVNTITGVSGMAVSASHNNVTAQPVTIATNASQELTATVTWSANTAGNSVTLVGLILEELN